MGYDLKWYSPTTVLRLEMQNALSLDEMKVINQKVVDILDTSDRKLTLLVDVSALAAGYPTVEYLRMTQLYRDHGKLDTIIVIANSKLNRLIALLAFHLSRAHFIQFDSIEQARFYLSSRNLISS